MSDSRGPGRPKTKAATAGNKPVQVEIKMEQHFTSRIYTSGSTVRGNAVIHCQKDTPFDNIDIVFTGTAATRLDFVQSYTTNAVRTFMKLRMPIPDDDMPSPRICKAGETYTIPFHFVVPHQLTMGTCKHASAAPAVQDHHLRMPPTVGYWDGDDQAPDMTHIEYAVRAKVIGARTAPDSSKSLVEGKKILKVLPATPEEPPLDITKVDERYCLSKTKTFRKNLLGAKAGDLTASSAQPSAAMLHGDGFGASGTTATVNLEFAPASSDATPPKINSVQGKLLSTTFFGSASSDTLPNLGPKTMYTHHQVLTYSATTGLFHTRPDKINWIQRPAPMVRRDSGYETAGSPAEMTDEEPEVAPRGRNSRRGSKDHSSGNKKAKSVAPAVRHRATLKLPVEIPISNKRMFLPTFHSCIMSRTYALQLVLSVGPSNTTMTLHVPIQLGVETLYDPETFEELPSFDAAMEQAQREEAEDYLTPRLMQAAHPPQMSVLPGYQEATRSVAVA
ncbi:uncharacterized protein J7T54_002283 [Emericellopsis cladophorae]|uniref:Arrestin n=1 Tax=Emericellopsis cladophorae TaxID=2686198 RepID=A0A9P9Y116_9HYPO|nr:uncharacterized protein J7T54_002283 [Emericellopsis cladophorae]KAI6781390.1 hypothetical protein J7T54_002283 [Emericellopsis cladophorae]